MIKWELERVTPEMAARWLEKNDVNRKLREHRCAFLARAIEDGKWVTTHQGIAFARSGRLLDGQHRLRAIILANTAVDVWVARNVPEEAFAVMDAGLPRKMYERLSSDPRRTMIATTLFRTVGPSRVPHEYEVDLLLEVLAPSFRVVDQIRGAMKATKLTKASVTSAVVLRIADEAEGSDRQLHMLNSYQQYLAGDIKASPKVITSLYRQVLEGSAGGGQSSTEFFARAWYAFDRANEEVGKIQMKDTSTPLAEARRVFRRVTEDIFS